MRDPYIIICSKDAVHLQKTVCEQILNGYLPVGGLTSVVWARNGDANGLTLYQAMILQEYTCPQSAS